jgi:putative ABC transport system permease protein
VNRLVLRAARRFYLRHPWQLALAVLGIGLGVAVYVGVDIATVSARRAFELSTELARGRTTHRLLPVGDGIPVGTYAALVRAGAAAHAAPIVELDARIGGVRGPSRVVLGVDPVEEAGVRGFTAYTVTDGEALTRLMTEVDTVIVPEGLAAAAGVDAGDRLVLSTEGRLVEATVAGISSAPGGAGEPPIVTDIGTAERWSGRPGLIDRIDLRLDRPQTEALGERPPMGTTLVVAGTEDVALDEMMRAFQTNLRALGLLALAVGMFLIYATMSFAVLQRRPVIGILRALGLGRRELLGAFLIEALVLGGLGTMGGLLVGHWLASGLVAMVLQTVGDLSFGRIVAAAAPSPWVYVFGAALGLGATLIAALGPSLAATRETTDQALGRGMLERRARRQSVRAAWTALPVLALAVLVFGLDNASLVAGFAGLALVLGAGALLAPVVLLGSMSVLEPLVAWAWGSAGVLAVRGVGASLSRTGVATAALAVAVATVIGVGIMIASFRTSLEAWLDTTLTADLYVSLGESGEALDASVLTRLRDSAQIEDVTPSHVIRLTTGFGDVGVRATRAGPDGWGLDVEAGSTEALDEAADAVAVAEPLAYRQGIGAGDRLELPTPDGPRTFEVAAIYRDYNAGGASLTMPLDTYRRYWQDDRLTGLGIHLAPGAAEAAATALLRDALGGSSALGIRSTTDIARISLTIFDRTFEITEVLRWLAGLIAFFGILSAAMAIQLERARELALLGSLGFTPGQIAGQVLVQTGLLGLGAAIAAIPVGTALAGLLVHVINRRSFGWTMELDLTLAPIAAGVVMACSAALVAGLYPAWRSMHQRIDAGLRDE